MLDPWHLPLLNTLILLTSGTTVTWAHHALLHNDRQGLKMGPVLTILLGLLFTSVQAYEYINAPFAFAGNIYGATFFMATGFHGFHVIIGTIFLTRLPGAGLPRPLHAAAAFRLRGGRLVLALRRRGLAVPLRLHLCLGECRRDHGRIARRTIPADDGRGHGALSAAAADRDGAARALPALRPGAAVRRFPEARAPLPGLRPRLRLRQFGRWAGRLHHHDRGLCRGGRAALVTEIAYSPPIWVHAVLWGPLVLILCLGLLRPLKGVLVAAPVSSTRRSRAVSTAPD